jgi:hypothetical protein
MNHLNTGKRNIVRIQLLFLISASISLSSIGAGKVLNSDNVVVRFYISPEGDDKGDGSINNPFATPCQAKRAVRELKKSKAHIHPVEIIFSEGTYFLDKTLVLTPEDSGSPMSPVTWKAAAGERVVISGGKAIVGSWQPYRDGIWYIDLPETKGWLRNINKAETYKETPENSWHFRQLFVNGKRAIRARYPNADDKELFLYAVEGDMDFVKLPRGKVKPEWNSEPDAQINIVSNWRFFNQWNDVVKADPKKSILHLGPRERHGKIIKGNWFWIEGVKSELDRPGEWYLDVDEGRLYYKPEKYQNPDELSFTAPYLNRIVYLKGDVEKGEYVENIRFEGLEFRNTTFTLGQIEARVHTDAAVMMENTSDCVVQNCHFENIGGYALWMHLDSKKNIFHNNTVYYPGAGGVLMTGSRLSYMDDTKVISPGKAAAKVAPILNDITCNTVKHCGKIRYYGGGVHLDSRPASMAMMPGNYIAHNHFEDLSRNGIFAFRNQGGNVIEYNLIKDCMQTTIDGAAIHFATMNRLNSPNFILNNYLYDIWGYEQLFWIGQPAILLWRIIISIMPEGKR